MASGHVDGRQGVSLQQRYGHVSATLAPRRQTMPTPSEIEAAARVLCRVSFYQLPAKERTCSADLWPDADVGKHGDDLLTTPYRRWETFGHEARLALEAAEAVRMKRPEAA